MKLDNKLPNIYNSFFNNIKEVDLPNEIISTCESCTLCLSKKSPYTNTKCCTYHPHLANYLVGGIFESNNQLGVNILRKQIKSSVGINPYGIIPSKSYAKNTQVLNSLDFWNRPYELANDQLCPYYDKGNCSIWEFRENLCVTHFCASSGGQSGQRFWKKLNQYIQLTETTLSQYAMMELGWPAAEIKTKKVKTDDFDFEDEAGEIIQENYQKLWREWAGREEEFYKACYQIVQELSPEKFHEMMGLNGKILEQAILDTHKEFSENVLPDYMQLHPELAFENKENGEVDLKLGNRKVSIPAVSLPILKGFNGKRTTVEVYHLGFKVLFNLEGTVDQLIRNGMLIPA